MSIILIYVLHVKLEQFPGKCFIGLSRQRQWHPTPVLLPGKSRGRRSLVGCSPWGRWELDTTQWLHFHFSLSCIGEGDGNPLQCSCLENPMDGGAWWATVHGSQRVGHNWATSLSLSLSLPLATELTAHQHNKGHIRKTYGTSLIAQLVKNPPAMQETLVRFLGQDDCLEKG